MWASLERGGLHFRDLDMTNFLICVLNSSYPNDIDCLTASMELNENCHFQIVISKLSLIDAKVIIYAFVFILP